MDRRTINSISVIISLLACWTVTSLLSMLIKKAVQQWPPPVSGLAYDEHDSSQTILYLVIVEVVGLCLASPVIWWIDCVQHHVRSCQRWSRYRSCADRQTTLCTHSQRDSSESAWWSTEKNSVKIPCSVRSRSYSRHKRQCYLWITESCWHILKIFFICQRIAYSVNCSH